MPCCKILAKSNNILSVEEKEDIVNDNARKQINHKSICATTPEPEDVIRFQGGVN
jgi:hypothetical protein